MIIKSAGLPGATLKAWVIFNWTTNVILAKSGNVASVTTVSAGNKNINFDVGTFATTEYMATSIGGYDGFRVNSKTVTTAQIAVMYGAAYADMPAGEKLGIYFYEL